MAEAKPKAPRRVGKRRAAAALGAPSDRALILELLKEMHHLVLDAAKELGVSAKDAKHAMELAATDSRRSRPSEPIMKVNYGIAILLNHWRNDKRFQRPEGTPRVLSIRGKGATFENLARTFVPSVSLNELIPMVCENAEVTQRRLLFCRQLAVLTCQLPSKHVDIGVGKVKWFGEKPIHQPSPQHVPRVSSLG